MKLVQLNLIFMGLWLIFLLYFTLRLLVNFTFIDLSLHVRLVLLHITFTFIHLSFIANKKLFETM